jgi:hypothetical protein
MEEKQRREIEEIIGGLQCPKGFLCYESGLKTLCKAQDIGMGQALLCLEKDAETCSFSLPFGHTRYCKCPLRVYIAKRFRM